jgi:tight adherence protein B
VTQSFVMLAAAACAFLAIVLVGFMATGGSSAGRSKRLKAIAAGTAGGRAGDTGVAKRRQMADAIKQLREREAAVRKNRAVGRSVQDRLNQANLSITLTQFWAGSAMLGAGVGAAAFFAGAQYYIAGGLAFAAAFGLPRWLLHMAIKMRQKKFLSQFADAIDVIVRGVKSGLPLNDCLRVIARESSQPLAAEFERVCDNLAMGVTIDGALNRLYQRMPLQEVNFFNIVLAIQAKAGGNLSEALGNLSNVLRSRKLLREKIKALSSEAKASALIIGSLPIIVMFLVYSTTPGYIMTLFTHPTGHLILMGAACLMAAGTYIMRQMINFDF